MVAISATAPGKAVLCGEYAVLYGAPSVCLALNSRAVVSIRSLPGRASSVTAPGYFADSVHFLPDTAGQLKWLDAVPQNLDLGLVAAVWRTVSPRASTAIDVTLDTRAFLDGATGRKLGVGSSAALAVALTGALCAAGDREQGVLGLADAAHREFQQGRGSGIDVATSYCGGVVRFERGREPARLGWPEGLRYRLLWSGKTVSTDAKLMKFAARSRRTADADLKSASTSVVDALERGGSAAVMTTLSDYARALRHFDETHRIGIYAAGHRKLADLADGVEDLVYKPCGAGGGDIGVAVAPREEALHDFAKTAEAFGFSSLGLTIDPSGVQIEQGK